MTTRTRHNSTKRQQGPNRGRDGRTLSALWLRTYEHTNTKRSTRRARSSFAP